MKPLRLGMVGLDTSHVTAFATLLHDASNAHHVPGARVVAAYPGGSPDFALSIDRVEGFTKTLRDQHNVKIVDGIAALRGECDAILLESVDGRVHLDQFREIANWNVPVFIDKPLTVSSADATALAALAAEKDVRVMSCSALRYAEAFQNVLGESEDGAITGGDFFGPMALQEQSPGFFWYGIHAVEMLFTALGPGCREVAVRRNGPHDLIIGQWSDGRIGTVRGNRTGNNAFGGTIHREKNSKAFNTATSTKPFYADLLEQLVRFFTTGETLLPLGESVEIIRFIEAANESTATGKPVALDG